MKRDREREAKDYLLSLFTPCPHVWFFFFFLNERQEAFKTSSFLSLAPTLYPTFPPLLCVYSEQRLEGFCELVSEGV